MADAYGDQFYNWVTFTADRSARVIVPVAIEQTGVKSLLDVGCGQGGWLRVWEELGISDYQGLDGAYVSESRLRIPKERFTPTDLATVWNLGRKFDLVQSLEVAEHLPEASARLFISCLCAHGDIVMFSAAQPGQGGEFHINEQPPRYWAALFAECGYAAYDSIRHIVIKNDQVDTWYRFNVLLYANDRGAERLSAQARSCKVDNAANVKETGNFAWNLQRSLLRLLPVAAVTWLSRVRYRLAMEVRHRKWKGK